MTAREIESHMIKTCQLLKLNPRIPVKLDPDFFVATKVKDTQKMLAGISIQDFDWWYLQGYVNGLKGRLPGEVAVPTHPKEIVETYYMGYEDGKGDRETAVHG